MTRAKIIKYTVEFDALDQLSDDFVKRIIYEFFRSKVISVERTGDNTEPHVHQYRCKCLVCGEPLAKSLTRK